MALIPNVSFCTGGFLGLTRRHVLMWSVVNVPWLIPVTQWLILDVNEY